ncbi:AraC family transcriptional regulator [Jejuia pallidilutea]|jgi:AraC-like DNA-binding protein|uniref:Transcriptional regulator n=1 Tax=Jejuia pallidilutea TaxID=504487 RepID=A0A090VLI2_9FLAO|nr:AraC family transcriptional regulator [Jejuia pallidilutea]PQV49440.1 AraC family transcriptional regulator [Jejuia pallidilutea]GAL65566.1 transcriptional regulator [Jejuia pallidilutea]GAL88894.1 transcriptional regulator [Jejuia pallidilutea]
MIIKKPTLEKLTPSFGSSMLVRQHMDKVDRQNAFWHFHPELELVYVNKGQGKTHIGNHLSYFNNSQLILIGANLPHNGFADRLTANGSETTVQFKSDFLGDHFVNVPEMANVLALFTRAEKGIRFGIETKKIVGPKIDMLLELQGLKRVILFLEILDYLANTEDYILLNADGIAFETNPQDSEKIKIIYKYINANFQDHITLEEIADKVSMTVPAFCRYFKKTTGKTFTQMVNEYRIVHATKLLNESQMSIADICYECGFNNFSHFNKQFNEITGKSASQYRKEIRHIIQ